MVVAKKTKGEAHKNKTKGEAHKNRTNEGHGPE